MVPNGRSLTRIGPLQTGHGLELYGTITSSYSDEAAAAEFENYFWNYFLFFLFEGRFRGRNEVLSVRTLFFDSF